ncbi:MAG: phenylalanine 4-monooxygenase, partial [Bacteroidota bacterium]|nr:phenylalanine 4-monooxygenase [Bacteroidota bacterium]
VGKLEGINLAIEDMSPKDLEAYGIVEGKHTQLKFEGGIVVEGIIITGKRDIMGKIQLISFKDCTVTYNDEFLFKPEWGVFDMAVGKEVVSVFAGPADDNSFLQNFKLPKTNSKEIKYDDKSLQLHKLYFDVKKIRESGEIEINRLKIIYNEIISNYSDEWLILLEIYEILFDTKLELKENVENALLDLRKNNKFTDLIDNGLKLIK